MKDEVWKYIRNTDKKYMVSSMGRVKSLCGKNEIILKGSKHKDGYPMVGIKQNGKRKHCTVHRLMAIEFLQNPENKPQVNHINGIKDDNRIDNLEWNTNKENINHMLDNNMRYHPKGSERPQATLDEEIVMTIITLLPVMSQSKLAEHYGVNQASISAIKCGRAWGWMNITNTQME